MTVIALGNLVFQGPLRFVPENVSSGFNVTQASRTTRDLAGELFGFDVDFNATTLITGSYSKDTQPSGAAFTNFGAAYIYELSGSSFTESAILTLSAAQITGAGSNPQFGFAVAISGDWAAVAANQYATNGTVFIYRRVAGVWGTTPVQQISPGVAGAGFGASLSMDGDTLAIGHINANSSNGGVDIYTLSGSTWSLQHRFTFTSTGLRAANNQRFGYSVAVNGNIVVAGGPGNATGTGPGMAFFATRTGSTWSSPTLLNPVPSITALTTTNDGFGASVAYRANRIAVGMTLGSGTSPNILAGRVVLYTGVNFATQTVLTVGNTGHTINDSTITNNAARVGISVEFNDDGTALVAGASSYPNAGATPIGAVYVFQESLGTWSAGVINNNGVSRLDPNPNTNGQRFGNSVSIANNRLVVGAPGVGAVAGAFYLFT